MPLCLGASGLVRAPTPYESATWAGVVHGLRRRSWPRVDAGSAFHTGGAQRANFPEVRARLGVDPEVDAMAWAFGAPFTLHAGLRGGSLREAAHEKYAKELGELKDAYANRKDKAPA